MTVKGSTRKRIRSDRAAWSIEVRGEQPTLAEAFATLDNGVQDVRRFLEQHGFAAGDVGLGAIDTTVHHALNDKGQELREITGYSLSRSFYVTTEAVDRVRQTAGEVTSLIQQGVFVISRAPQYYYSDIAALKIELIGAASADARARATEIAKNAGCGVGEVRAAQMGVLQVTRPLSTETSGEGVYDTSSIEKDVQAVVAVTFRILGG